MFAQTIADGAVLRPLEPWRAEEFQEHIARDRPHLAEFLPWAEALDTVAATRAWLQRYAERAARDDGRIVGLWLDGRLVGGALYRIFEPRFASCEVGVWIELSAQGRGLVTRAAREMLRYAFDERGFHRVEWRTTPRNHRSIAVARRLGMTREGVLRGAYPYRGVRNDVEVWSILAAEWESRSPSA